MSREIKLLDYGDRDSWLASRSKAIGASEVAALFVDPNGECMSPYTTPFKLWAEKTGLAPPEEMDQEYIAWGTLLEPAIAARYESVTGRKVWMAPSPYAVAQHPELPMLRATPDRWVIEHESDVSGEGLLQLKNTNAFAAVNWNEGPPDYIQIQVQAEMAVTGRDWCSVAVLIGGCRYLHYDVERNDAFIREIEKQVKWFWDKHIVGGVPPEVDSSARTEAALKRMHPDDNGETIELDDEAARWLDRLERAKRYGKIIEDRKTLAENQLRAMIGDNTFGKLPDGRTLSLKTTTREERTQVVKASKYRTLRAVGKAPKPQREPAPLLVRDPATVGQRTRKVIT